MPGEHITLLTVCRVVCQQERRLIYDGGMPANMSFPALPVLPPVVITSDHFNGELRMRAPPKRESMRKVIAAAGGSVHEVAQHDETLAVITPDELAQALQVSDGRTARQRYASAPENIILAKVCVGDDQRGAGWPKERPGRMQYDSLSPQGELECSVHQAEAANAWSGGACRSS